MGRLIAVYFGWFVTFHFPIALLFLFCRGRSVGQCARGLPAAAAPAANGLVVSRLEKGRITMSSVHLPMSFVVHTTIDLEEFE